MGRAAYCPEDAVLNLQLENESSIIVVGGGPAGAFFAIEALSRARSLGRRIKVVIIEQKERSQGRDDLRSAAYCEGCNHCAGGISPRLVDVLNNSGISLTPEIIQSEVDSITIQGNWKHIELKVPPGRKMYAVFRGSSPSGREKPDENFDSNLLLHALKEGAEILRGEATGIRYGEDGRPVITYRRRNNDSAADCELAADFAVIAGGINKPSRFNDTGKPFAESLKELIPGFSLPRVRKALICELKCSKSLIRTLQGEMHFVEYGSRQLKIEMSSIVPKKEGFITIALLGQSIDNAGKTDIAAIVSRFLDLPHVKRLFPPKADLALACGCNPSMTIGTAKLPYGHRVAVIGDMVVSRLYKDGILSANNTARALVDCIFNYGIDSRSLKQGYLPIVNAVQRDNRIGKIVFVLNRIAFSDPVLSRILYQAVVTERKSRRSGERHLEELLWKIASGDDSYAHILSCMTSFRAIRAIVVGGALVTVRNYATELFFGLKWREVGRFPTGVYREIVEAKRKEYADVLGYTCLSDQMDFERMYSIKIKSTRGRILEALGLFGEDGMEYFKPRIVKVHKVRGEKNEEGKIIRYETPFPFLSFSIILESFLNNEYILYRVHDGFAKGGLLIFDVKDEKEGVCSLSIYVAFNFPRGDQLLTKVYWWIFRHIFPQYVHDVLWNHSLCEFKDIVEGLERFAK